MREKLICDGLSLLRIMQMESISDNAVQRPNSVKIEICVEGGASSTVCDGLRDHWLSLA